MPGSPALEDIIPVAASGSWQALWAATLAGFGAPFLLCRVVICQWALRAPLFSRVPFIFDKHLNSELVNESSENAPWNRYPQGISFTLLQRGSFGKSVFYYNSREREKS